MSKTKIHFTSPRWTGKRDEFERAFNSCSSNIKALFGSINNATYCCLVDSVDALHKCKDYYTKYRKWTKNLWKVQRQYEYILKSESDFFNISFMSPETRAMYADDLTTSQYFDFWYYGGCVSYKHIKPLCDCLTNKYKLMIEKWGVEDAEHKAPLMTAYTLLKIHDDMWQHICKSTAHNLSVELNCIYDYFRPFRLLNHANVVRKILDEAIPELKTRNPDEIEARNIEMSKQQIFEKIDDADFLFGGIIRSVIDYDDMFKDEVANKGMLRNVRSSRKYFETKAEEHERRDK